MRLGWLLFSSVTGLSPVATANAQASVVDMLLEDPAFEASLPPLSNVDAPGAAAPVTIDASAPLSDEELAPPLPTIDGFAGRRFDLAEDGEVRFEGGPVNDPQLNLSASTSIQGVAAKILIGGHASVTSLSPTQALQLAAALNSLRGSGGGLNPLGKLRSASGIDRLRALGADKTAGRGTALTAGQYLERHLC